MCHATRAIKFNYQIVSQYICYQDKKTTEKRGSFFNFKYELQMNNKITYMKRKR